MREQSTWRELDKTCQGEATYWNPDGTIAAQMTFKNGVVIPPATP